MVVKRKKPESLLASKVANYLRMKYPTIPYRFDIGADIPLPPVHAKRGKELHGSWSTGYPDLFICTCRSGFGGLYIELKATDKVPNTEHTRRQAVYHEILRKNGYMVEFACGFKQAKKLIKGYLK